MRALAFSAVSRAFFGVHSIPKNVPLCLFNRLSISLTACVASFFSVLSMLLFHLVKMISDERNQLIAGLFRHLASPFMAYCFLGF
jgi:hypothetical protein